MTRRAFLSFLHRAASTERAASAFRIRKPRDVSFYDIVDKRSEEEVGVEDDSQDLGFCGALTPRVSHHQGGRKGRFEINGFQK